MENIIYSTKYYIYSFFAMFVTLLSFVLLSLQIAFISILWVFSYFIHHLNHKFTDHEVSHKL